MAELTPQEILSQLKVRGFESGFQKTPLREFVGTLSSITGNMVDRFTPARLEVQYNFADVEVISSIEPYPFPITQIGIFQSNREQSAMGVFGKSVDNIINKDVPADAPIEQVKGQDYLIGKKVHMKMTGGHMMWDGATKKEVARDCWECVGVEGFAMATPISTTTSPNTQAPKANKPAGAAGRALELLNGKNEQQFYQAVFNDPIVKADGGIISSILARSFLQPLIDGGIVMKDGDGIYHTS